MIKQAEIVDRADKPYYQKHLMFARTTVQKERLHAVFREIELDLDTFPWHGVMMTGSYLAGVRLAEFDPELYRDCPLSLYLYGTERKSAEVLAELLHYLRAKRVQVSSECREYTLQRGQRQIQLFCYCTDDGVLCDRSEINNGLVMAHLRYAYDPSYCSSMDGFVDQTGHYGVTGVSWVMVRECLVSEIKEEERRGFQVEQRGCRLVEEEDETEGWELSLESMDRVSIPDYVYCEDVWPISNLLRHYHRLEEDQLVWYMNECGRGDLRILLPEELSDSDIPGALLYRDRVLWCYWPDRTVITDLSAPIDDDWNMYLVKELFDLSDCWDLDPLRLLQTPGVSHQLLHYLIEYDVDLDSYRTDPQSRYHWFSYDDGYDRYTILVSVLTGTELDNHAYIGHPLLLDVRMSRMFQAAKRVNS